MGWEQLLYAFLLRRVLGPYLTPDSLKKLHESTEVSLQEGRLCLSNIELNAEYLTSKQDKVYIQHAIVRKLEVRLAVGDPKATENTTSINWRAMYWSREDTGISLQAHIEIDGLEIQIGPRTQPQDQNLKDGDKQGRKGESKTTSSSVVSSYIDAAISSLQLSANLKNIKVQIMDASKGIQIQLAYAKYYDQDSHDLSMCKGIDFSGISIESLGKNCHQLIAKLDGGGQISIETKRKGKEDHLQQDITVNLYRRMNLSISETSIDHVMNLIDNFNEPKKGTLSYDKLAASEYFESASEIPLDDEKDEKLVKDIMEQYVEAREYAERNEVRGGILIADSDTSSFDAFFDANDLSFSNYISTLEESLIMSKNNDCSTDFIHTQLKVHLGECRIKITFPKRSTELSAEYVLLTFGDLNAISTISGSSSDLSLKINRCEAETSVASSNSRPEIKTLFCFEQTEDLNCIVSESSCIDFQIKKERKSKSLIDLRLKKIRIEYCHKTVENFGFMTERLKLQEAVSTRNHSSPLPENNENKVISIWTDGVTLLLPIGNTISNDTLSRFFERCGYSSPDETTPSLAAIGLSMEGILISSQTKDLATCSDTEEYEVSCVRALTFVTAPFYDLGGENRTHRMDILSLSGQAPMSAKYTKTSKVSSSESHGELIFPKVPAISSFKVREDDDEIGEHSRSEILTSLRSPDPQPAMLKDAQKCHETMSLSIPDICVDLTKRELYDLTQILSACGHAKKKEDSEPVQPKDDYKSVAFAMNIDNVTFCIHNEHSNLSLKILGRRWKFFAVLEDSAIRCARALTHELDLYSCQQLVYRESNKHHFEPLSVSDRCDAIRQRTIRNVDTKGTPVLYRSQLFPPLSLESPAMLLDLINGSDQSCSEWTIYLSLYNMTHRCGIESSWYTQLFDVFRFDVDVANKVEEKKIDRGIAKPGLMKIFVTIADCNFDYSTPKVFNRESRSILRFSDIRFSSNMVSPRQPIQTFRLSIDDASLLIGNTRHSYNAENACLSRSVTVLSPEDVDIINAQKAAPDLQQMDLVTILTLDSFIANISKTSTENQTYIQTHGINEPTITSQLTFGNFCMYGCKDSFECFNDTAGELLLKFTGLTSEQVSARKQVKAERHESEEESGSESSEDNFFDSNQGELGDNHHDVTQISDPRVQEFVNVTTVNKKIIAGEDFELGGYDWTTIDHEWSKEELPQGEEQVARWYDDRPGLQTDEGKRTMLFSPLALQPKSRSVKTKLISHYIQLKTSLDSLAEGDMDAARHAGTSNPPSVSVRVLIHDLKVRCRFFDGYDWPKDVIKRPDGSQLRAQPKSQGDLKPASQDRKDTLMEALLEIDSTAESQASTFENIPLPEERGEMLKERAEMRRLSRRINRFVHVSLSGLKVRADLFEKSRRHRLASCVELNAQDFFLAETISNTQPVKMLGEWFNDVEHPRDTNYGLIMMKMVTWKPKTLVTFDDQICSDEAEAVLQFLPFRCHINQHAIRFLQSFFYGEGEKRERLWASDLTEVPPPNFLNFKVRPCKLKINYNPEKVNFEALRDGSIVELVNLSPLNDMLITLQSANMKNKLGFGDVFAALASSWIQDISSTQLHKFVTSCSPFQPMTSIGSGAIDMVILPWDAIQNGDNIVHSIKVGLKSLTGSVIYEALNVTAKLTGLASRQLSNLVSSQQRSASLVLPSRPPVMPRNLTETADHAIDSIAKGFETAGYKIIIIPYREYQRKGVSRAAESIVRGIPVAILAPIGGASEALSYTLLGARNQVRPDIRKEEEASQRELHHGL